MKNVFDSVDGLSSDMIIRPTDVVNEIGCIHTVQGYDLNIAGVIFGPEIRYDKELETIIIDKSNYFDRGKKLCHFRLSVMT